MFRHPHHLSNAKNWNKFDYSSLNVPTTQSSQSALTKYYSQNVGTKRQKQPLRWWIEVPCFNFNWNWQVSSLRLTKLVQLLIFGTFHSDRYPSAIGLRMVFPKATTVVEFSHNTQSCQCWYFVLLKFENQLMQSSLISILIQSTLTNVNLQ